MNLHIGGTEAREGWTILNIQPGPGVDYVGTALDLGMFADQSVEQVYASHVLEHLGYQEDLVTALKEIRRVLKPGGILKMSVPDLDILCRLFVHPDVKAEDRFLIMRMMFGGQVNEHDFHRVGLNWDFLLYFLNQAGFTRARRVEEFGLFDDTSSMRLHGTLISLNVEAW